MAQTSAVGNPFMMMLDPEVVLAAIERSEHLGKLERRLCRPLDRHLVGSPAADDAAQREEGLAPDRDDDL
jgi:hypothetical protein